MNVHHNNCCHPLDKKSPVPVNHGRPSKSNVGDKRKILWCKPSLLLLLKGVCHYQHFNKIIIINKDFKWFLTGIKLSISLFKNFVYKIHREIVESVSTRWHCKCSGCAVVSINWFFVTQLDWIWKYFILWVSTNFRMHLVLIFYKISIEKKSFIGIELLWNYSSSPN